MISSYRIAAVAGLLVVGVCAALPAASIIPNPGFEQGESSWRSWPRKGQPSFGIDSQVAHTGKSSARIEVAAQGVDGSWVQDMPCEPGTSYGYSFYFRTSEPDKRVSFLAEFTAADGSYGGQHRMEFRSRGTDWTRASGTYRTPLGVRHMSFGLWVNLDNVDVTTAWFDDGSVRVLSAAQQTAMAMDDLSPEITRPAHRVLWTIDEEIVVRLPWPAQPARGRAAEYRLALERGGQAVAERSGSLAGTTEVRLPASALMEDGEYDVTCVIRWAGRERQLPSQTIVRAVEARQPEGTALLDESGSLRVDGKPFLPIGVYWSPVEKWADVKAHGFNTVHTWLYDSEDADRAMATAERLGLKTVIEMSDTLRGQCDLAGIERRVNRLKGSPALLAWYPVDEPAPPGTPYLDLLKAYNLIRRVDPFHPTMIVYCDMAALDVCAPASDIVATDPYGPTSQVVGWVRHSVTAPRIPRGAWAVLRAFYAPDLPTPDRLRCDTYIALISGAKGLFYFSFGYEGYQMDQSPLWEPFTKLNRDVTELAPVLLNGEKLDVPPGDADVSQVGIWRHEGYLYILAVNCKDGPAELTFALLKGVRAEQTAEVLFENRTVEADGAVRDRFEGWGTHVYRVRVSG